MRKLLLSLFFTLFAQGALAQTASFLPGCVYNATPPTLADRQQTVWQCDINGKLITSGTSNPAAVIGPSGAPTPGTVTDNAIVRWDGTTGTLVQNSVVTIDDTTGSIKFNTAAGTLSFGAAADVILSRGAAGVLEQANAANAQTLRVFNSRTDASNGSWGTLNFADSANVFTIGTKSNGTGIGVPTKLQFVIEGVNKLDYAVTNAGAWSLVPGVYVSGLLTFAADTYAVVLGGTGAPRGRIAQTGDAGIANYNGFFEGTTLKWLYGYSGSAVAQGGTANSFFVSRSSITASDFSLDSSGNTIINGMVKFAGSTSSFPALKRSTVNLEIKLADDSTYSSLAARTLISAGAVPTLVLAGGTCAGTAIAGGSTAGTVTLTGVCVATNTLTLSVMPTAPTGYACDAVNRTLGTIALAQTGTTATTAVFTFLATTGATDVLSYKCIAY